MKLVNPANKRKYSVIVVGTGLAGGAAAASLAELGYNVQAFCYQDSPAPRALDRRAGRHQRREELPERRRQRLPPLLRHGQGRRLPRPRGERLPPRRAVGEHHRPVRRAGRAVRARVRRHARQPLLRRRAGLAHVLRARPDRPAAPARRLPGARAADRPRHGEDVPAPRDARPRRRRRPGPRHRRARPGHGRARDPRSPTRSCSRPAATATSSTSRPTRRAATPPRSGAPTRRAPPSRTPATRRSTRPASPCTASTSRKLTLMTESLRNDGRIWVPKKQGDTRPADRDPRGRARLLPRAQVPEPTATSPRATSPRARPRRSATRGAASGPGGLGVYLDFADAIKRLGARDDRRAVRQPLRDVRAHHRRGPVQGPDAHLPRRRTTRWAGSGSTTTSMSTIPGLFVARRGELLRPRREPPRRLAR